MNKYEKHDVAVITSIFLTSVITTLFTILTDTFGEIVLAVVCSFLIGVFCYLYLDAYFEVNK